MKLTLTENLASTLVDDYRESGDEIMADAIQWIHDNPEVWAEIEDEVRWCVRMGRKSSLRRIIDNKVWEHGVRCKHSLTAAFQRQLAQRVPGYKTCFDMAKSKVDE